MNLLWTYEILMNFLNFLWTSYKLLMNFLWTSYELLMNFLWTSYECLMNSLWTSYERLTIIVWIGLSYRNLKILSHILVVIQESYLNNYSTIIVINFENITCDVLYFGGTLGRKLVFVFSANFSKLTIYEGLLLHGIPSSNVFFCNNACENVLRSICIPTIYPENRFKGLWHRYQKSKIDCLRFVMCPLLAAVFQGFFLWWPLTVLMKQTRQAVCAFKQSILLRCLWFVITKRRHDTQQNDTHSNDI